MPQPHQTHAQRWARRLIACYPARWRQRYAEELLLILEDAPPTGKTMLNLLLSLFDAYLHQDLVQERTSVMLQHLQRYEITPTLLQRMRSSGLATYGAALIFFVSWWVVQGRFIAPGRPRVLFSFLTSPSLLLTLLQSAAYLLPIFLLVGGLPILLAAISRAWQERKVPILLLCLLGLISPLIAVIAASQLSSMGGWFTPFSFLIGLLASLALIVFSTRRVAPNWSITHYALALATWIPFVMLLSLLTLLWLVVPSLVTLFLAGDILFVLRENLLILIMIGMLIFSFLSLGKGFQARRAMQAFQE